MTRPTRARLPRQRRKTAPPAPQQSWPTSRTSAAPPRRRRRSPRTSLQLRERLGASTDPVADAGDQLDVDVARCCARFGDESAERSTTKGSRTLIVTLKIDPTRSQASAETRQAWGLTAPLSAKLVFSGGATQYASGYCDAGIAVTAPDACIVGRQIERLLETFWRSPVHAVKRSVDKSSDPTD